MEPHDGVALAYSERDRIATLDHPGTDRVVGWTVQLDRAKRRLGSAYFPRRIVTLSRPLVVLNDEPVVVSTIRHEWAHVVAGARARHELEWMAAALAVGADPTTCTDDEDIVRVPARYRSWCARCNFMLPGGRYRVSRALTQPGWVHTTGRCRGRLLWIDTHNPTTALNGDPTPAGALDALTTLGRVPTGTSTRRESAS